MDRLTYQQLRFMVESEVVAVCPGQAGDELVNSVMRHVVAALSAEQLNKHRIDSELANFDRRLNKPLPRWAMTGNTSNANPVR
ncbi:hypothetical protein [Pseudomonas sp.]|uniref:hypothetical protein n=1 Tax=Pseudomonas sp. TaxID=306 RepID=UPI003CC6C38F